MAHTCSGSRAWPVACLARSSWMAFSFLLMPLARFSLLSAEFRSTGTAATAGAGAGVEGSFLGGAETVFFLSALPAAGPPLGFFVAAGAAPGGAMPGMMRCLCTEGVNLPAAEAVAVAPALGTFPTGALSLLSSFASAPVLPVVCSHSG